MTYDKQDLLLDLRRLTAEPDRAVAQRAAELALLRYVDDEHITAAFITLATGVTR